MSPIGMKTLWHTLKMASILVLVALWFHTALHEAVCHDGEAPLGDACAQSGLCACVCASHPADAPSIGVNVPSASVADPVFPDYLSVAGTTVLCDIFRPPVANG